MVTIWRNLSKPHQRRKGTDPRLLWLLVGSPSVFGPELASRRAEHSLSSACLNIVIPPPPPATKLGRVYWNHHPCPSDRPSVCPAAFGFPAHNCFPFTPIIMKLHMQTPHEARMCPIDFEVKRSRSQCINYWKWFPAHNCFPFTPIIMKLHMQTPHEARMCPIDFEVRRLKVKVTMHKLLKMVSFLKKIVPAGGICPVRIAPI